MLTVEYSYLIFDIKENFSNRTSSTDNGPNAMSDGKVLKWVIAFKEEQENINTLFFYLLFNSTRKLVI